jgi:hypothetical protein
MLLKLAAAGAAGYALYRYANRPQNDAPLAITGPVLAEDAPAWPADSGATDDGAFDPASDTRHDSAIRNHAAGYAPA